MTRSTPPRRPLVGDVRLRLLSAREALADPNLAKVLVTWVAWVVTDWAFLITVSVMALEIGGAAAVGLVGAVRVLPAAVLSGLVAVISDRLPRPLLLAVVNAAWCLVALTMAWFAIEEVPLLALLVVIGLGSAVSAVLKPCLQALVPQLVQSPSQLIVANSAYATLEGAGTIVGPVLCGLLLVAGGPPVVFVVLAAVYAAAAVAGWSVRTPFQPVRRTPGRRGRGSAVLEGIRLLTGSGTRVVFGLFMLQTTMRGFVNVFVILVATAGPEGNESRAAGLFAAIGVGGLIGSVFGLGGGAGRGRGVGWFALGIALWGVPIVVIGLWTEVGVAWVALGLLGLGNALADIFGYSMLNRLFPDHLAGRGWGAFHSVSAASVALGSLCAPLLAATLGLSPAMVVTGTVLALAPLLLWPRLRALDARAGGASDNVEAFRRLPLFAPLSLIAIERLARAAAASEVDGGTVVVRQHDPAEAFYVVVEGELSVWQDTSEVRRLGVGDAFGEIGLLQARPRTASVVAERSTRLLSLDAEAFVSAVTGHRATDDLVRASVHEVLSEDARRVGEGS